VGSMERRIKTFETAEDLAENLAVKLREDIDKKKILNENFYLSLSGGNTPKLLFMILASPPFSEEINWNNLHLFWGDERCVPPEDDESNYGAAKNLLFDKTPVPSANIHRIKGEEIPEQEAQRYAGEINKLVPFEKNLPRFDCIYLGMGEDGHTASLFPGKELYGTALNICGIAEKPDSIGNKIQRRISLTKDVICNSEQVIFLITGKGKADTLSEIIHQSSGRSRYPASNISNIYGFSEWWLDQEAASKL